MKPPAFTEPRRGAALSNLPQEDRFVRIGSPLGMHLPAHSRPTRITVERGVNLVLRSISVDCDDFGPFDRVKLVIRFVDPARQDDDDDGEWLCLCNFLGGARGGTPLPACLPFPFEVAGPCVVDVAARGSSAEHGIHVVGHVLAEDADRGEPAYASKVRCADEKRKLLSRVVRAPMMLVAWAALLLCLASRGEVGMGVHSTVATPLQLNLRKTPRFRDRRDNPHSLRSEFTFRSLALGSRSFPDSAADTTQPIDERIGAFSTALDVSKTASPALSRETSSEDCINLTMALLPYSLDGYNPFQWSIHSTHDGDAISWSKDYFDPQLHGSILMEHSSSEVQNSTNQTICLSPGNYTFKIEQSKVWYVISNGAALIRCGYLDQYQAPLTIDLNRPNTANDGVVSGRLDSGCPIISCAEDSCLERLLKPLQCYNNFDIFFLPGISNGAASWLSNDCADVLDDACQNGALGFEAGASVEGLEQFCAFFRCVNPLYQESLDGSYRANCACLYSDWACEVGRVILNSAHCDQHKCCTDKNKQHANEIDVEKNCECVIEPSCTNGDDVLCEDALEYCCSTNQGPRECNYLDTPCENSIQQNRTDTEGDFLYCLNATMILCKDDADEIGCQCTYWESLCADYPSSASCEEALIYCCGWSVSSCDCDFLQLIWKNTGFKHSLLDLACSLAEGNIADHSSVDNDRITLTHIYQQLGGKWWIKKRGWLNSEVSHCTWYGVKCNARGRVSRLELRNNNLTGNLIRLESKNVQVQNGEGFLFGGLYELEVLTIGNNSISGSIPHNSPDLDDLRVLYFVDLSENELTGVADILFSPSILYLNLSHNNLTSIGHIRRYNPAYSSIQVVDLSSNMIDQDVADVLLALPLNLEKLVLSNNFLFGTLPSLLPVLEDMTSFAASNNYFSGTLIDFSRAMPRVAELDLANQKHLGSGGITGFIPKGIAKLYDLVKLDLSGNQLKGSIPAGIGNLPELRWLNLSNNKLRGTISHNFGRLAVVSDVFDVSGNKITGTIPASFKDFTEALVRFDGNEMLSYPAPLGLCYDARRFDLAKSIKFCPPERNALYDIFQLAKGQEWTNSVGWGSQFGDPCTWYGIVCDNETKVAGMNLPNNGLSGILSPKIGDLRSLENIDLSDNDIKGSVPDNICKLSNLKFLRLNYNDFSGTMPTEFDQLQHLELVQLQSNRLTGEIRLSSHIVISEKYGVSSFISDCGVPTDFEDVLKCMSCTMCCNVQGECHSTSRANIPRGYEHFSWILILSILSFLVLITLLPMFYIKYWKSPLSLTVSRELVVSEKLNAWSTIGSDSVYSFFLSRNVLAWMIALSVISFQSFVFFFFVQAAEISFEDDKKSFIYSWRCPRNSIECEDKNDQSAIGWFMFSVLLASHLLKDVINGGKLLLMSTKSWHHRNRRIRFFIGGIILILISVLATYATTVYNIATARSNTELVSNAVIILFLTDVDEQFHQVIKVICPKWLDGLTHHLNSLHPHPQCLESEEEQRNDEHLDVTEEASSKENTYSFLEVCAKLHQIEARLDNMVQVNGGTESELNTDQIADKETRLSKMTLASE